MSAKDRLHNTVVQALKKDGWSIRKEQFFVNFPDRRLWIDIQAVSATQEHSILIEVKGFENTPSPIEYLASVVGKYMLYRLALEKLGIDLPLYLAVPAEAYEGILSEPIGRLLIQKIGISLIVFKSDSEEIVKWIR